MEHADLVMEMRSVEGMSTAERLQLARRRRVSQLKSWAQRERDFVRSSRSSGSGLSSFRKPRIRFSDSVVLLEAASRNDVHEVRKLLLKGVSPDSTNEDGLTALHQCCIDDNEDMMKLLLEFGANVNAEDSEKWTPLHAAATCGHLHLVKQLISHGANLLAVNADGNMPYDICEDEPSLEYIEGEMAARGVTQGLIDHTRAQLETQMLADLEEAARAGLDLEPRDIHGATPLHIAAANGYMKVAEFLLDHHVATDVKDNDEWQPVHAAACWGHLDVLELLVANGADLNARTKHDETPAEITEDPELRERIRELRLEQEKSRREAERKRRVVRRSVSGGTSGSHNRRVKSVRRTSIRDRGLQAKRDAREEQVLLRLGQDSLDGGGPSSLPDQSLEPARRGEPEGKDSSNSEANIEVPAEASYTTEESNGKINIHVSVTINAGTLAELKRQRAQSRVASPEPTYLESLGSPASLASLASSAAGSPDSRILRFAGQTSEPVVADGKVSTSCPCNIL